MKLGETKSPVVTESDVKTLLLLALEDRKEITNSAPPEKAIEKEWRELVYSGYKSESASDALARLAYLAELVGVCKIRDIEAYVLAVWDSEDGKTAKRLVLRLNKNIAMMQAEARLQNHFRQEARNMFPTYVKDEPSKKFGLRFAELFEVDLYPILEQVKSDNFARPLHPLQFTPMDEDGLVGRCTWLARDLLSADTVREKRRALTGNTAWILDAIHKICRNDIFMANVSPEIKTALMRSLLRWAYKLCLLDDCLGRPDQA